MNTHRKLNLRLTDLLKRLATISALGFLLQICSAQERAPSFAGRWAFSLPDGNPAWLKIEQTAAGLKGSMLWSVGSARPVVVTEEAGLLKLSRKINWKPFGEPPSWQIVPPMIASSHEGRLHLAFVQRSGSRLESHILKGTPIPPLPPRPDLTKVNFAPPVTLLGKDLNGWRLTNAKKKNGWRVEDGILINETPKTDFGAYGSYGNLRTEKEFEDFELTIDYNVAANGNSGIYLRGMYEVQVVDRDSRMQGINGPGAVFGRIKPTENAANPPGEWNTYVLTLVDRHITVNLNGVIVIDNQPLEGCTGGGILADDTRPGPIFLQGDHTSVKYRNISLRPLVKNK